MRTGLILLAVLVAAGLAVLWHTDLDQAVMRWALAGQREAQNGLARALRSLHAKDPGAVTVFLALCFAYGFFHAVGPGHGKILIGGYGVARRVSFWWLSAVAFLSSLGQAMTAVLLVGAGFWVLGQGRVQLTTLAEDTSAPLSFALIALVGLWLAFRGARGLWAGGAAPRHHHSVYHPCGHAHAPDAAALAGAQTWYAVAALVGAVAIRPCTGALFVLILTAQLGLFRMGILGSFAMAFGTASVTVAVAIAAVTLRKGTLAQVPGAGTLARVQPLLELGVGVMVAVLAGSFVLPAL
ncbi:MAG: hypothetical protein GDA52_11710 [Rhodobacteraceae bacterium]|nr:hypothetical protein [Paracoccaceae bacterium]